jgi:DNA-binding MarR family transcriptional regulator
MPSRRKPEILRPLDRASRRLSEYCTASLQRTGLPHAEAQILCHLYQEGPCPVGELRRALGHRGSTLTSLLDRLDERGLARRAPSPDDRRSLIVRATARGRALAARARRTLTGLEESIARRLRPSDLKGFREVLAALDAATGADDAPPPTRRTP